MSSTADRIDNESRKSPERLEREIDQQRAEIGGLVDALEQKLSPGQMFDRLLEFGRGNGRELAENFGTTVRSHPVPMMLTAVGLAWLYASRNEPAPPRRPSSGMSHAGGESVGDKAHEAMDRAREMGEDVSHSVSDSWNRAREHMSDTRARLSDSAHHASDTLAEQKDRMVRGYNRMLDENPLALGAIGVAVGALLGAALPRTETEDRFMGEARDDLVDRARDSVHQAGDKAREAVHEIGEPDRGVRH